jgi:hypothetical protein
LEVDQEHVAVRHSGEDKRNVGGLLLGSMLGYGVICNSILTLLSVVLWSSWHLLAPFAEEPWREHPGAPFAEFAATVRRYL